MKPLELLLSQNLDLAHAPELSSNMNGASGTDFRNTRPPVGRSHGPTFGWNTHGTPDGSNQARPPGNNEDADAAYRQGIIWRPRQALGPPLHPSRRSDASIRRAEHLGRAQDWKSCARQAPSSGIGREPSRPAGPGEDYLRGDVTQAPSRCAGSTAMPRLRAGGQTPTREVGRPTPSTRPQPHPDSHGLRLHLPQREARYGPNAARQSARQDRSLRRDVNEMWCSTPQEPRDYDQQQTG